MKCRDCNCAVRGFFKSVPEAYVCIGTKEPFVISNYVDAECNQYYKCEKKEDIEDTMIRASNRAGVTKEKLLDEFMERGLMGVYNLGLRDMCEYLK